MVQRCPMDLNPTHNLKSQSTPSATTPNQIPTKETP